MRKNQGTRVLAVCVLVLAAVGATGSWAADSPADRTATDPKAIPSPASESAKPVPIEDLFYSRRVSSPAKAV